MTLEFLQEEMKNAMKSKDNVSRDVLRSIISSIKKTVIDERCDTTEELIDRVLLKEKKTVQEQIDTCPSDRVELLDEYKTKMVVLDKYCPKLMTDTIDIEDYIEYIIENYDVDISNMGTAMKTIMPHLKGKCDMKIASSVIKGMCF